MSGVFIAFEGGEGAGKSTQASCLESYLRAQGYNAVLLREPGSTQLGDYLRAYLVNNEPIVPSAELLLFEASRAQLVEERVRPLLDDGAVVIAEALANAGELGIELAHHAVDGGAAHPDFALVLRELLQGGGDAYDYRHVDSFLARFARPLYRNGTKRASFVSDRELVRDPAADGVI